MPEVLCVTVAARDANRILLTVSGVLDLGNAVSLLHRLQALLRVGYRLITLDLSSMTCCGITGIAVLLSTNRQASTLGGGVRVVGLRPAALRARELRQIGQVFPLGGTDDAWAAASDPASSVSCG
ncbi:MAG: STAS domain-containing protein [Carbonactinosporaceae bacterium]